MTRDYNWRTDFNWQDKNDEPVEEAKFPNLTRDKRFYSFRTEKSKQAKLTSGEFAKVLLPTNNNRKDLN